MKNKIFIISFILCGLILLGCSRDDAIFEETPQVRKDAQVLKLEELIESSLTFEGVYFPNDEIYGGSLIYFKFDGKDKVKMSSGFDEDTDVTESFYGIDFNSSVELNFQTYNHISKLSQNDMPGLRGTGFEGSHNFIFMGEDNDGGILLKDARNLTTFSLTPIPEADFNNSEAKSKAIFENKGRLGSPTSSVFKQLQISSGENVSNFDLNYDSIKSFANPEERLEDGSIGTQLAFGLAYTPEGLVTSPPVEFEDNSFVDFTYDEDSDTFRSTDGNAIAILGSAEEPAYINDDYLDFVKEEEAALGYRPYEWGDNSLTSAGFDEIIDEVNYNLGLTGRSFNYFQFNFGFETDQGDIESFMFVSYISGSSTFLANYSFSVTKVSDKKFFVTYNGPANSNGELHEERIMPLIKFFTSEKGLLVTREGSFSATAPDGSSTRYSNKSGTVTSLDSPSQRVYVLMF